MTSKTKAILLGLMLIAGFEPLQAAEKSIVLQSTTSTANSGLYKFLLPTFHKNTGIKVNVVAVGTGQAIKNAKNCDGDVLLVHAKSAEQKFVQEGYGVKRFDLMYNDFVIVGPKDDPAKIDGMTDVTAALKALADRKSVFASRGDNSGTHKAEMRLWKEIGIDPTGKGSAWYRETGSGMGATLNLAVGMGAYTITDRGTWISFRNRRQHKVMVEGDKRLFNQYGVILVNPDKCVSVHAEEGQKFVDWITGKEGQGAIAAYKLGGEQLFFPNAKPGS